MGFSAKQLDSIPHNKSRSLWESEEKLTRNDFESEQFGYTNEPPDKSMALFEYIEAYIRYDYSNNGMAELRKVIVVGDEVLANDPAEYMPFSAFSAIRQPHSHIGMSIAQTLLTIQKASSHFMRQLFDNTHTLGTGRTYIDIGALAGDELTLDGMQDRDNEVVFVSGRPADSIMRDQPNPIAQAVTPLVESFEVRAQRRSGITAGSQMDPDVLQKTTASSIGNAQEELSNRLQLVIQTLAETGFKSAFIKAHSLLRQHISDQQHIQIGDKWHQYKPSQWTKRTNVVVSTGLGLGNKAERMQFGMQLLGIQKELLPMGLVTPQELFNSLNLLVESFNIGDSSNYFIDPSSPRFQPPQPPPDPQMELAKAEMQKAQAQQEANHLKNQMEQKQAQLNHELESERLQLERIKLQMERLKLERDEAEARARIEKMKVETMMHMVKTQTDVKTALAKVQIDMEKPTKEVESKSKGG